MNEMAGLHVLIVPSWWPSPEQPINGVFFIDYAQAFAAAGAKIGVIYPDLVSIRHLGDGTAIPWRPRLVWEQQVGVPVVRLRGLHTAFGCAGLQMRRFRRWLRRGLESYQARHGEPDVLLAMCAIPAGWACTHLADPLADRVVITEHTGPFSLVMDGKAGEAYARAALTKAASVATVSERSRQEMQESGIDREITVCGNPVADDFLNAAIPTRPPNDPPRGLFVGRLVPEKGIGELLDAALSPASMRSVEWHFAGDGPMAPVIRTRFAAAGLPDRPRLHGHCDRSGLVRLMAECDFLVSPSYAETFGMAVAEATCTGLPVVATRTTGCADFVNQQAGVLVDPRNVESLASGLTQVLDRLPWYDRPAIAARARESFNGAATAAAYARIFRVVVEGV